MPVGIGLNDRKLQQQQKVQFVIEDQRLTLKETRIDDALGHNFLDLK